MADDTPTERLAAIARRGKIAYNDYDAPPQRDFDGLVAAVEAVLELHVPVSDDPGFCGECGHSFPCWTRRGIERELTGEDGSDER